MAPQIWLFLVPATNFRKFWNLATALFLDSFRSYLEELLLIKLSLTYENCFAKYQKVSFCEVGYANFRPNVFVAVKRISVEILVAVGLHEWCPVALKRFVVYSKNGSVQEKYLSSL